MLFSLWFYNFIKKMNKRKRIPFCGKKKTEKKTEQCYHNDICR